MTLVERYVFKQALTAFVAVLLGLTAVIWVTQALREIELLTSKGQTFFVFLGMTLLSVPTLLAIIAPFALFIATLSTLNKLNGDSELIVMSASGVAPGRLARPFALLAAGVCLMVGWLTIVLIPDSFRNLRDLITQVRADIVTKVAQEGQFTTLDSGVTFHFRERSGDALLGVFLQDNRDPERPTVYLAEKGQTLQREGQSYLVLEKGSVQRAQGPGRDPAVVVFSSYAVDLSQLADEAEKTIYKPRERSTAELLNPDRNEFYVQFQAGRFRAELHDRFSAPLFPLACMMIAFAALGGARTTRQGRGAAIFSAIVAIVALRVGIFGASSLVARNAAAAPLVYLLPLAATGVAGLIAFRPDLAARLSRRLFSPVIAWLRALPPSPSPRAAARP